MNIEIVIRRQLQTRRTVFQCMQISFGVFDRGVALTSLFPLLIATDFLYGCSVTGAASGDFLARFDNDTGTGPRAEHRRDLVRRAICSAGSARYRNND